MVLTSVHPGQEPSESEDEALGFRDAVGKALRESDMVLGQFRVLLGYDGAARGILAVVGSRDIRCVKNHELLIGDSLRMREGRQRSRRNPLRPVHDASVRPRADALPNPAER